MQNEERLPTSKLTANPKKLANTETVNQCLHLYPGYLCLLQKAENACGIDFKKQVAL